MSQNDVLEHQKIAALQRIAQTLEHLLVEARQIKQIQQTIASRMR